MGFPSPTNVKTRDARCPLPKMRGAGCETHFIPSSVRNRFCLRHRKRKPRDPQHYIRYGTAHRRLRKQWASRVAAAASSAIAAVTRSTLEIAGI